MLAVRQISSNLKLALATNSIWQRGYRCKSERKRRGREMLLYVVIITSAICNSGSKSEVVKNLSTVQGVMTGVLEERKDKTLMGQFLK